jgi:hypothetical protein
MIYPTLFLIIVMRTNAAWQRCPSATEEQPMWVTLCLFLFGEVPDSGATIPGDHPGLPYPEKFVLLACGVGIFMHGQSQRMLIMT